MLNRQRMQLEPKLAECRALYSSKKWETEPDWFINYTCLLCAYDWLIQLLGDIAEIQQGIAPSPPFFEAPKI